MVLPNHNLNWLDWYLFVRTQMVPNYFTYQLNRLNQLNWIRVQQWVKMHSLSSTMTSRFCFIVSEIFFKLRPDFRQFTLRITDFHYFQAWHRSMFDRIGIPISKSQKLKSSSEICFKKESYCLAQVHSRRQSFLLKRRTGHGAFVSTTAHWTKWQWRIDLQFHSSKSC